MNKSGFYMLKEKLILDLVMLYGQNLSDSEFGRKTKELLEIFYNQFEFLLEIEPKETE